MDSRNPIAWVLKAKAKESDGWTEVLQVTNANMEAVNHRAYAFDINNQGSYQYFRIEFTEVGAPEGDDLKYSDRGQTIQLSELYMSGIEVPVASVATVKKAPAAKTLTYNGQPQELITAGEADGGDMKYASAPEEDKEEAQAEALEENQEEVQAEAPAEGQEEVQAEAPEEVQEDAQAEVQAEVPAEAQAEGQEEVQAEDQEETQAEAQEVQAAAPAESQEEAPAEGTLYYSLDGENYDTAVPTAVNAGEYTVWYKLVSTDGNTILKEGSITVTIEKADVTFIAPVPNT